MTQVVIRVPTAQALSQRVDETIEQKKASGERLQSPDSGNVRPWHCMDGRIVDVTDAVLRAIADREAA